MTLALYDQDRAKEVLFNLPLTLPLFNRHVLRVVLLRVFGIFHWVHVLPGILEQPPKVVVCACGDWPWASPMMMST